MTEQLAKPIPPVPATEGCYFIPCGHCSCALVGDDGGNAYCHPCSLVARVRELEQALEGYEQHECGDTPDYGDRLAAAQARIRELEQERDRITAVEIEQRQRALKAEAQLQAITQERDGQHAYQQLLQVRAQLAAVTQERDAALGAKA